MNKTSYFIIFLLISVVFTAFTQADDIETINENHKIDVINNTDEIDNTEADKVAKYFNSFLHIPQRLDLNTGFDFGFENVLWLAAAFRLDYKAGPFTVTGDITFINDQKYAPAAVLLPSGNLGGFYFLLNEGGISYNDGPLFISAGRYRNYDEIDSPYSLYLNSMGISANTIKFRWESDLFIYQTQWIELNSGNAVSSPAWNEYQRRLQGLQEGKNFFDPSSFEGHDTEGLYNYGFPDRGLNYKVYGFKLNDHRIGFLDAAIYTGKSFDFEYFFSPIPMYFTQYFKTTTGRPWATQMNNNCLMGFFWDVKKPDWDAYAQILIDDFSFYFLRFLYSGFSPNPWKTAWTLGGRIQTSIGRFGFHHGGALKFTYEPIGTTDSGRYANDSAATAYGYTYYPETRYYNGSETVNLLIQDNMIGYKHGQNNIAFQVDYQNSFNKFLVTAELEFLLAGSNSPSNPWQDYDARSYMYNDYKGSQLLNDDMLEKKLEFRLNVSRQFGRFLTYVSMALGGRFNRLELQPPNIDEYSKYENSDGDYGRTVDNEMFIWKATKNHEFIYRFSIGFRYLLPVLFTK